MGHKVKMIIQFEKTLLKLFLHSLHLFFPTISNILFFESDQQIDLNLQLIMH